MTEEKRGTNPPRRHQGADHSAPYPVSRLSPAFGLVDLARQISQADTLLAGRTHARLKQIGEQIRHLQEQARQVLEEAQRDHDLHHAECAFEKRPGRVYHLYRRPDGRTFFSMLAPGEWGGSPPHRFLGSWRLQADLSWRPADQAGEDDALEEVTRLLEGR